MTRDVVAFIYAGLPLYLLAVASFVCSVGTSIDMRVNFQHVLLLPEDHEGLRCYLNSIRMLRSFCKRVLEFV